MAFLYPWKGSSVAIWIPERKSSPRSSSQFLYTVPDLPGTRSNKRAVGCSSPQVRSTMPVSSRGPRWRRSWWCHTCSSTPSTRIPVKRAGSSDAACRHGLIWDHTVFHVVPNCRASPKIVAPSKRNCRIAQRIARTPRRARGAHIEWFCSLKVAIWQVVSRHIHRRLNHRIRTGTPAQGASITSTTTRPWPCAITPQPGQPARRSQDSMSSIRPYSRRAAATRWKPSKPTSRSHRSQRLSDTEQQQVG